MNGWPVVLVGIDYSQNLVLSCAIIKQKLDHFECFWVQSQQLRITGKLLDFTFQVYLISVCDQLQANRSQVLEITSVWHPSAS